MPKKNQQFWQIQNSLTNSTVGEIYLYEDIASKESWWSDQLTPKTFKADLDALGDVDEIELHINSGGGDVHAASAIYSMLKNHKAQVTTFIDGMCGSAATIPAQAGDVIKMCSNGFFMIHNPSTGAVGEEEDFRRVADLLAKVKKTILANYTRKTGLSDEEVSEMMNVTTWLTADEALEKGFIDNIFDLEDDAAVSDDFVVLNSVKHDLSHLKNFPTNKIKNSAQKAPKGMKETMTPEEIRNQYPEAFKQIANAAQTMERERISKIDNLALKGAEEIIQNAKDNGLSEAETAIQIINWQKESNAQQLQNMQNETSVMNGVQGGAVGIADLDEMDAILNRIEGGK